MSRRWVSRPWGSYSTAVTPSESCPSRNTVAPTRMSSPGTAVAGKRPPSITGLTSVTGIRPYTRSSDGNSSMVSSLSSGSTACSERVCTAESVCAAVSGCAAGSGCASGSPCSEGATTAAASSADPGSAYAWASGCAASSDDGAAVASGSEGTRAASWACSARRTDGATSGTPEAGTGGVRRDPMSGWASPAWGSGDGRRPWGCEFCCDTRPTLATNAPILKAVTASPGRDDSALASHVAPRGAAGPQPLGSGA